MSFCDRLIARHDHDLNFVGLLPLFSCPHGRVGQVRTGRLGVPERQPSNGCVYCFPPFCVFFRSHLREISTVGGCEYQSQMWADSYLGRLALLRPDEVLVELDTNIEANIAGEADSCSAQASLEAVVEEAEKRGIELPQELKEKLEKVRKIRHERAEARKGKAQETRERRSRISNDSEEDVV